MRKMHLYLYNGYRITNCQYIHYDARAKRTVVYAEKAPKGFRKLAKGEWAALTPEEKQWAMRAGCEINRRALKECEADNVEYLNRLCDVFETELKKEKEHAL